MFGISALIIFVLWRLSVRFPISGMTGNGVHLTGFSGFLGFHGILHESYVIVAIGIIGLILLITDFIKGHKIELVVLLTAFYGLRRSEVIGLKWSAFDFNHNCFSIRHTVTTCNVKGERVTIKKDKAKNKSSLRTYPLIPFLKERLLEAKKQQEENRKLCGRAYNKEYLGYVCVDVIGNLIKPNYVSSTFGKLLAKNNLRHIRFHDLRHTCASLLLANGVPMEQVKEWLGHSEISTTVDIYGHLQYATKKQSAAAIEQDIVAPMLQNLSAVSP